MTDYVDRCICGYFVTQKNVDEGCCPECERCISNLSDQWTDYENLQIEQPEIIEITEKNHPDIWKILQPPELHDDDDEVIKSLFE